MLLRFTLITAFIPLGFCLYGQDSSANRASKFPAKEDSTKQNVRLLQDEIPGNFKNKLSNIDNIEVQLPKVKLSQDRFKQTFLSPQILPMANNTINSVTSLTKSILNPLKKPVTINNVSVAYDFIYDSSYIDYGSAYSFGNLDFSGDLSVGGIPLLAVFQNQNWSDVSTNQLNRFSFRFDKDQYLDNIKNKLRGKYDPASLLKVGKNPLENLIAQAQQTLSNEINNLNDSYKGILNGEIGKIGNLQALFNTDINNLKKKFLNADMIKSLQEKQNVIAVLQQKINNGENINLDEMNNLQKDVLKSKAINELIEKIAAHKVKWEQSGLLQKLRNFKVLQKSKIAQAIKDPSNIRKLAKEHLSLKGLQKFFLNVNQLNIGQSALSLSPMSFQHFLSNGITAEFARNLNKTIGLVVGRQKDFNSILDYAFADNINSNNGIAKAIRVGVGSGSRSTTHVAVSTFNQSLGGPVLPTDFNSLRQVLVTTISNQLSMGQKGSLAVDLSRSATQYHGSENGVDSFLSGGNNVKNILSLNNLMSNTAISLKYSDEYAGSGLNYQINFSKISNGYNNPGNAFLSGGSTEAGIMVRKSFLKNKILISFRGNTRHYKYNDKTDMKWRNDFYVFDARWRLKKGQHIAFRYQPVRMLRIEGKQKNTITAIERLSAEANFYKRIGKVSYRNFFSLTHQKNLYTTTGNPLSGGRGAAKNISLLISSFQHVIVGKEVFYVNVNYNHAEDATGYLFLNSSLFTEAGYSYRLTKNITASTGCIYNSTKDWYRQAGIRQTLSGQLGEKFSLNLFIDAKKNLKVYQNTWNDPIRADISLRYNLNNRE